MKKMLALMCALGFAMALTACGGGGKNTKPDAKPATETASQPAEGTDGAAAPKKELKKNEGNRLEGIDEE